MNKTKQEKWQRAYGDTPDEACENLEQLVDEFVSDMYMVEEFV